MTFKILGLAIEEGLAYIRSPELGPQRAAANHPNTALHVLLRHAFFRARNHTWPEL